MKKIALIFGGQSTEHDVSKVSGQFVSASIDKEKYEVTNIYIDKNGKWYEYLGEDYNVPLDKELDNLKEIENVMEYLKKFDCAFPVLHGLYGEDGTIQGLLELLQIPYVGCKVLASSVAMDKVYSKIVFNQAGLDQVNYEYIRKNKDKYIHVDKEFNETECNLEEVVEKVSNNLNFPVFIKPSNSGSSVGINKAKTIEELKQGIKEASKYDKKILIEEGLDIRELECAVLGNEEVIASCVGEVVSADEFYDYESKYNNADSKTITRADIPKELENKIRKLAIKAYKSIDGKGLSRVDFFLDKEGNIYINEINTIPGFTGISMYPKLFEASGIAPKELTTKLIELAFED